MVWLALVLPEGKPFKGSLTITFPLFSEVAEGWKMLLLLISDEV